MYYVSIIGRAWGSPTLVHSIRVLLIYYVFWTVPCSRFSGSLILHGVDATFCLFNWASMSNSETTLEQCWQREREMTAALSHCIVPRTYIATSSWLCRLNVLLTSSMAKNHQWMFSAVSSIGSSSLAFVEGRGATIACINDILLFSGRCTQPGSYSYGCNPWNPCFCRTRKFHARKSTANPTQWLVEWQIILHGK